MIRFLARRLGIALGILLAISFVVYGLLTVALDPMFDLRQSTALNKDDMVAARVRLLHLDEHWTQRYWRWLTAFVQGDPGISWGTNQKVADQLPGAISTSVQLVVAATFCALLVGVIIGVTSALRQYTSFDYAITLISFVLFSLPVFWVAVLLKEYLAIGVNNYLANPKPNWIAVIVFSLIMGFFWAGALGGKQSRRLITFAAAAAITFAVFAYILLSGWLSAPKIGIVGIGVIAIATAFAISLISAGLKNRRALYAALTMAVIGLAIYLPLQNFFYYQIKMMNNWMMLGLAALTIVVAVIVGLAWGGDDKGVSIRGAAITGLIIAFFIYIDQVLQYWKAYNNSPVVRRRPIATIGSVTPGLNGNYWMTQLDKFTHLLLPSIALILISFAGYVRYERGATLEVLNQDYIRTARAKGLPERVVIVRHALRNALMPLASIIPVDIVSLIGGAVITETIFGWAGMGRFFITSLAGNMIDPVMVYVMITGALAMTANLMADFLYALLDPRIRVNA